MGGGERKPIGFFLGRRGARIVVKKSTKAQGGERGERSGGRIKGGGGGRRSRGAGSIENKGPFIQRGRVSPDCRIFGRKIYRKLGSVASRTGGKIRTAGETGQGRESRESEKGRKKKNAGRKMAPNKRTARSPSGESPKIRLCSKKKNPKDWRPCRGRDGAAVG